MEGKWLFYGILGSIVLATNAWALVPDRTATVTALAIGTAKCGGIASAKIDGMYTNDSLKLMGLTSGIQITTDTYYNRELSGDPPHNGSGDGTAEIWVVAVCNLSTDSEGYLTHSIDVDPEVITSFCDTHAD